MPDATLTIPCCFRSCFALDVRVFLRPTPRSRALLAVRPAAERDPSATMSEPP